MRGSRLPEQMPPRTDEYPSRLRWLCLILVTVILLCLLATLPAPAHARAIAATPRAPAGLIVLSDDTHEYCPTGTWLALATDASNTVTHRGCWTAAMDDVFIVWFGIKKASVYPAASFEARP